MGFSNQNQGFNECIIDLGLTEMVYNFMAFESGTLFPNIITMGHIRMGTGCQNGMNQRVQVDSRNCQECCWDGYGRV